MTSASATGAAGANSSSRQTPLLADLLRFVPQQQQQQQQRHHQSNHGWPLPQSAHFQPSQRHDVVSGYAPTKQQATAARSHYESPQAQFHYQQPQFFAQEQCQAPIVHRSPIIDGFGVDPSSGENCSIVGGAQAATSTANSSFSSSSFTGIADEKFLEIFNPEELNFSDHQMVWLRKEWLDILFRVSFVAPIVLLGIVGNLTIIYSMCKFKPFRSKPTNIFILNMAIADLLTTLVCPTAALFTDIYQFYVLGSFLCRFEGFVKITCLLVSSYSLIVLSLDWLLCVVRPCRTRISIRQSWLALCAIWITSVLMASPLFVWRRLRERHWRDLVEVWCCELIQYTKYYWVVITFFLIYLPTFFMTIVLVIILAKMDKYEAKLKRSCSSIGQSNNNNSHSHSLTINMKYRRRIVKILFTYLLTSIICWTPLQFTIIYRHFRSDPIPSPWFFELAFFAQLSASLTAAMNPIIFGFLSQPFRRMVAKSLMFRFLNKAFVTTNTRNSDPQQQVAQRGNAYGMNQRHFSKQQNNNDDNKNGNQYRSHQRHSVAQHHLDQLKHPTILPQPAAAFASKRAAGSQGGQHQRLKQSTTTGTRTKLSSRSSKHQHIETVSSRVENGNKRVSFNTSTILDQQSFPDLTKRLENPNQWSGTSYVPGRDNVAFEATPDPSLQQLANGKRLAQELGQNRQDKLVGCEKLAGHSKLIAKMSRQQGSQQDEARFNTTSFIQREQAAISLVSMDSVNIEENFCLPNLNDCETHERE